MEARGMSDPGNIVLRGHRRGPEHAILDRNVHLVVYPLIQRIFPIAVDVKAADETAALP